MADEIARTQLADLFPDFELVPPKVITLGTLVTQVAKANASRWLLMMQAIAAGQHVISTVSSVIATQGFIITTSTLPLIFFFRDHAILATSDWYGIVAAGTGSIMVQEVLYRPAIGDRALQEMYALAARLGGRS